MYQTEASGTQDCDSWVEFDNPMKSIRSMEAVMSEHQMLTAQQIADQLGGQIVGDAGVKISAAQVIQRATPADVTFLSDPKRISVLKSSATKLVLAPHSAEQVVRDFASITFILVDDPEMRFLQIAGVLHPRRTTSISGVSQSAVIASCASIGDSTVVGHCAVIGRNVKIGRGCRIEHGTVIEDGCVLGDNVILHPNCVLYSDVIIGNDVTIHATCVIGADGFGYRTVNGRHERLPHYGTVRICDDVEIGAGTTIDRAKVGETIIGTGTRIDNQVMIGHNCQLGPHNLIVSQVGFAGSTSTGSYVVCGGQAGIADHVHLGDGAVIGGKTGVHRDMKGGQAYFGTPAAPINEAARNMTALRRLPQMRNTIKQLERDVAMLQQQVMAEASRTSSVNTQATAIPAADGEIKAA